jgi:hypothetical protein
MKMLSKTLGELLGGALNQNTGFPTAGPLCTG